MVCTRRHRSRRRGLAAALVLAASSAQGADAGRDLAASAAAGGPCVLSQRVLVVGAARSAAFDAAATALSVWLDNAATRRSTPPSGWPDACEDVRARLATGDAANGLGRAPVDAVIVADPGGGAAFAVHAHIPGLVAWAASPFVSVERIAAQGQAARLAGEAIEAAGVAALASAALSALLDGDLAEAERLRPPSETVHPLMRAWLSGLPVRSDRSETWPLVGRPEFDDLSAEEAGTQPDLLATFLAGRIEAAGIAARAAPAAGSRCPPGGGEAGAERRWAAFVAGFWRALADPRGSRDEADELDAHPAEAFARLRDCFGAVGYAAVGGGGPPVVAAAALERVGARVAVEFASTRLPPETRARRRALAQAMVATAAAFDAFPGLAFDRRERALAERAAQTCEPGSGDAARRTDLVAALDAREAGPLAPMVLFAQAAVAAEEERAERLPAYRAALDQPDARWIATAPALLPILTRDLDREAQAATAGLFLSGSARLNLRDATILLADVDDPVFEAAVPALREGFPTLDAAARLARALIGETAWSVIEGLAGTDVPTRLERGATRFAAAFPEFAADAARTAAFAASERGALDVVALDMLDALVQLGRFSGPTALRHPERNHLRRFASGARVLPEIPIPADDDGGQAGMLSLALARAADLAWDYVTAADDAEADAALCGLAAPLTVALEAFRTTAGVGSVDFAAPGPHREAFDALAAAAEALAASDEASPEAAVALARVWGSVRPVAAGMVARARDPASAALQLEDLEWATATLGALSVGVEPSLTAAANATTAHLDARPDWSPHLRRLIAHGVWMAVLAAQDADGMVRDAEFARLHAMMEAFLPLEARRRLLTAGFWPPILAIWPTAALAEGARSLDEIIERAPALLVAEIGRLGLAEVGSAPGLGWAADLMQAFAARPAFAASLEEAVAIHLPEAAAPLRVLIDDVANAAPSAEAVALASLLFAEYRLGEHPDDGDRAAAATALGDVAALCPSLAPGLAALRAELDLAEALALDRAAVEAALRVLLATDAAPARLSVAADGKLVFLGLSAELRLAQGARRVRRPEATGEFGFTLGALSADIGRYAVRADAAVGRRPAGAALRSCVAAGRRQRAQGRVDPVRSRSVGCRDAGSRARSGRSLREPSAAAPAADPGDGARGDSRPGGADGRRGRGDGRGAGRGAVAPGRPRDCARPLGLWLAHGRAGGRVGARPCARPCSGAARRSRGPRAAAGGGAP